MGYRRTSMKRTVLAVLVALFPTAADADYAWPVIRVVDGDTLEVRIDALPLGLARVKVRVRGVDTPETGGRAKCDKERAQGAEAEEFTRRAIKAAKKVRFGNPAWGKYGGRIVADVTLEGKDVVDALLEGFPAEELDAHQLSLAEALIALDLGRAYDGGTRQSWCAGSE